MAHLQEDGCVYRNGKLQEYAWYWGLISISIEQTILATKVLILLEVKHINTIPANRLPEDGPSGPKHVED
jgi:hypothetical protein